MGSGASSGRGQRRSATEGGNDIHIGLISCSKSKTAYAVRARDLFQPSALFRGALGYVEGRVDCIYVLSSKYGLLPLDQVVAPYDLKLTHAPPAYRRDWASRVVADLKARHGQSLSGFTFEFHCGQAYQRDVQPLLQAAGATCISPVAGMPIGGRLHFYASGGTATLPPYGGRLRPTPRHRPIGRNAALEEGWHTFAVEPADIDLAQDRRQQVVPKEHEVRQLASHGVYLYFDGERCLYVGKSSDKTLVGRALDYLYEGGSRPDVYRVIRENATRLMIRGTENAAAARRLELAHIVAREPVLNEGFIYATPEERRRYWLGGAAPSEPGQVTGMKIHVGVWLGAALLHEEGHATFSGARLAEEIERRFGDIRAGVKTHISAHCVANAPKNTTVEYSYLYRTDTSDLRLYRNGDLLHPSRSGSRTAPDQVDIPEQYWDVWRRWVVTNGQRNPS